MKEQRSQLGDMELYRLYACAVPAWKCAYDCPQERCSGTQCYIPIRLTYIRIHGEFMVGDVVSNVTDNAMLVNLSVQSV